MGSMYEKYLSMHEVPAGKVLEVLLKKKNMSQKTLASLSNEYPSRISAYIKGQRKFTIKASIALEKVLGIDIDGFFILIQTNHEIYNYITEQERKNHPDLTKLSKGLFWDTRIEKINWIRNKEWVVQRTFEYGNEQEIEEIIRFYGKETVRQLLSQIKSTWKSVARQNNYQKYIV